MDPGRRRRWEPLLVGEAAARARRAIEVIAARLDAPAQGAGYPLAGAAARALFCAYRDAADPRPANGDAMARHLDDAVAQLARDELPACLHIGFVSVAWLVQHLVGDGADEANETVDAALLELTAQSPWRGDHDLLRGLAGIGVYAIERLPSDAGRQLLEQVIERLDEVAEHDGDRMAWRSRPELMGDVGRRLYPDGNYNVGAAHGAPALIAVLAAACAAEIAVARARPLLDGGVRWLLAQQLTSGPSLFPQLIVRGVPDKPARLAWCYGDPGVAAALLAAARAVGEPAWAATALAAGRRAAARVLDGDLIAAEIETAGLCHGSAGVALLLHRLWMDSREEDFARAARRLYEHAASRIEDDDSFLHGSAGAGLALLAATTTIEPAWDRLLAASLPPRE